MARYRIEESHAELLKLACLAAGRAETLRLQINEMGQTVPGSMGQTQTNPLIAAKGAAQKRVAAFLKQLRAIRRAEAREAGTTAEGWRLLMPRPPERGDSGITPRNYKS
jgi:hypothetical protein